MKQTEKIVPEDWITHLGGANREPIGWIVPRGEGFVAIDLLGRERSGTVDWFEAEETLAEATPDFVRVKEDDFNDINSDQTFHTLPFPVPEELLRELPGR